LRGIVSGLSAVEFIGALSYRKWIGQLDRGLHDQTNQWTDCTSSLSDLWNR
jgi:hypothetical protein